jgi:putative SOS response-associated peptidase YedK
VHREEARGLMTAHSRGVWPSGRCLISASGYYVWREITVPDQKKPAKMAFYVTRKDDVPFTFCRPVGALGT